MVVEWLLSISGKKKKSQDLKLRTLVKSNSKLDKIIKYENKMLGKPDEECNIPWIGGI